MNVPRLVTPDGRPIYTAEEKEAGKLVRSLAKEALAHILSGYQQGGLVEAAYAMERVALVMAERIEAEGENGREQVLASFWSSLAAMALVYEVLPQALAEATPPTEGEKGVMDGYADGHGRSTGAVEGHVKGCGEEAGEGVSGR